MLIYKKIKPFSKESKDVKALYLSSFPKQERIPYFLLILAGYLRHYDIFAIYDDEVFVSLFYYLHLEEWSIVMFFAVDEKQRSKAYGREILLKHIEEYPKTTVIMESMTEPCTNGEQRMKRFSFYQKCDLSQSGYYYIDNSKSRYDILATKACFLDNLQFDFDSFNKLSKYYTFIELKSEFNKY